MTADVSRETSNRLRTYVDLLRTWSPRINLVAPSTLADADDRHLKDSLQLLTLRPSPGPRWADLGSGGGLPGLVVAIAFSHTETTFTLVEADQRKAAFLRRAISATKADRATVETARLEALPPLNASTISARALAPLPKLLEYTARHIAPDGVALLMKGRNWRSEVTDAQEKWTFDLMVHQSTTDPDAAILEIGNLNAR